MTLPEPVPGLVIRYSYLWRREHLQGRDEGVKDRPCAVLLSVVDEAGDRVVVVLPISHSPPDDTAQGIEIPPATKNRLGLDDARSWIILTGTGPALCSVRRRSQPGLWGTASGAVREDAQTVVGSLPR